MNTKQTAIQCGTEAIESTAFVLDQLMKWAARCYTMGAREMQKEDAEADANVRGLVESGQGHLECSIDFTNSTARFILHIDHGGEEAQALTLFTSVFGPEMSRH